MLPPRGTHPLYFYWINWSQVNKNKSCLFNQIPRFIHSLDPRTSTADLYFTNTERSVPWPTPVSSIEVIVEKKLYNIVKIYVSLILGSSGIEKRSFSPIFFQEEDSSRFVEEFYGVLVFSYRDHIIYRLYCSNRRFFGETGWAFPVFGPPILFYDEQTEGACVWITYWFY